MRALSATYYTAYARERIAEAQQVVDRHVTSAYTGCCTGCGRPGPCHDLLAAQRTLLRYARLPRRRPGASLTGSRPLRSKSGFSWFPGRQIAAGGAA